MRGISCDAAGGRAQGSVTFITLQLFALCNEEGLYSNEKAAGIIKERGADNKGQEKKKEKKKFCCCEERPSVNGSAVKDNALIWRTNGDQFQKSQNHIAAEERRVAARFFFSPPASVNKRI